MPKVVFGVVLAGHSKDYAIPKFREMLNAWFKQEIRVVFVVDEYRQEFADYEQIDCQAMAGSGWCTDIVHHGKEELKNWVLAQNAKDLGSFDALVWQGIDCFYARESDIHKIITNSEKHDIFGALVAGRDKEHYPVCREFVYDEDAKRWTTAQRELPEVDLRSDKQLSVNGYIGSDATAISVKALEAISMAGYQPWHERQNKDTPLGELGPEEFFMWQAVRNNMIPMVDTSIRPHHAHETGRTVRYYGEVCHLDMIGFK